MSEHLEKMKTEEAKKIALKLYDQLKFDFSFDDSKLADKIQADLYEVIKKYSEVENLSGREVGKIIKQFYLNVLAQIAHIDLEHDLKEQKESAQKDLR